jgi:hypothetical protein
LRHAASSAAPDRLFSLAALHHVAQGKAGDHLRQGHRLVDFEPSSISVIQLNSWLTFFMRISAAFGLARFHTARIRNRCRESDRARRDRLALRQRWTSPSQWVKRVNES